MEDGSCQQVKRDNFTDVEGYSNRTSHKKGDQYLNLNGGADRPNISLKSVIPHHNKFSTSQKPYNNEQLPIPKLNLKIKKPSNSGDSISDSEVIPKLPKPLITQYSTFRRVLKRPYEDIGVNHIENGDHKEHNRQSIPAKIQKLQSSTHKGKYFHKKRKSTTNSADYAQYLGLQPAVKFKCSKCCCSSFQSLGMLKEHQRYCLPQAPAPAPPPPPPDTNFRITRKVYLCSACGTYYENWNLFLHIREVHNRHTCLFCFGMFSQAQKLASHLVIKHNIQEDHFATKEDLSAKFSDSFYLLCCKCEKVFNERENFIVHECSQVVKQCSVCNVKGAHSPDCPKNSKHKRPSLSPGELKKVNKNSLGDKKPSLAIEPAVENNTSESSASPDKNLSESVPSLGNACIPYPALEEDISPVDLPLNIDAEVNNSSYFSVSKASPSLIAKSEINESIDTFPSVLKNNNNKEEVIDFPFSDKSTKKEICKEEDEKHINVNLDLGKVNELSLSEDLQNKDTCQDTFSEERSSTPSFIPSYVNMSQSGSEAAKVALKPPPRNRRPPKRYQFKNSQETVQKVEIPEVKETVNRVPKLTVKVPKILTEKESTSDYSSESEDSDKLTVDFDMHSDGNGGSNPSEEISAEGSVAPVEDYTPSDNVIQKTEATVDMDIPVAGEDVAMVELNLDRPLDRYPLKDLLRVFLTSTVYSCIYCNHARKVAVNAKQLGLHFIAQHRFTAVVDSITAEELMPETIVLKIKSSLQEVQNIFLNLEGYDTEEKIDMKYYDHVLECFQCFFVTTIHKDLYMHNRKMHQKTILLCIMCKSNFYSYSELLCHLCPGTYVPNSEIQFRCCLCQHDSIPSAFRLMVHLRKRHHACDVCLETCQNQSKLSNHVWKHKLHHLCYRCGIAYRNKPDITKHLFWKHGTESVLCKKCLQKRWPHVYHFCIPPNSFVCEECNLTFTKAVSLKVHKRLHSNDNPYSCTEENCSDKFISKKLLLKHEIQHLEPPLKIEEPLKPIIIVDEKQEKVASPAQCSKEIDSVESNVDAKMNSSKNRKSKKNKKNKEKDNLLIDVNLPALNLSESDSSEESEAESTKKAEDSSALDVNMSPINPEDHGNLNVDLLAADVDTAVIQDGELAPVRGDTLEEPIVDQPVADIWDNFKIYQAEIGKQTEIIPTLKPKHVCDSDHDYCVIPITEDVNTEEVANVSEGINKDSKKKIKFKKKNKKGNMSSSSDSSSDSDSSCSCGSNCSCSSSSGSSSSSSSSDSESSSTQRRRTITRKDSDASAVDIMATEESPPRLALPEPQEVPLAESDLDTDETETDEDFYDEHPQRLANKILAEKRNQLMLLATVAPVNNGTYLDSSRPATPENTEKVKEVRKKVKAKKKKKAKKVEVVSKPLPHPTIPITKICLRPPEPEPQVNLPNKITISLQTNTVIDKSPAIHSPLPQPGSTSSRSDADNKRASKRRRVPNKFYGYSSDEEYALKSHLPPKLEWRKEDLPSPSVVQPPIIPEIPSLTEVMACESKPVISPKIIFKEPIYSSTDEDSDSSREGVLQINHPMAEQSIEPPAVSRPVVGTFPFPRPAGARPAREGESVYCYCRCPYDEVSEMIACDAEGCLIEWFHFECVGIMVPPKGMWYCPDCRQRLENEDM